MGVYQCLMSLQETTDVRKLIKYSLHLQEGHRYKCPEGVFVPVPPRLIRKVDQQQQQQNSNIPRSGTMPSRPQQTRRSPKAQDMLRPRANSLKRLPQVNHSLRAADGMGGTASHNHELGISDGYLEDDPAVLKINIEYMVKVMAISRLKLQQYVARLRENLPQVRVVLD